VDQLWEILRCPGCKGTVQHSSGSSVLCCQVCERVFPVRGGIPRFVEDESYASTFGYQWNKFSKVQLDSYNGTTFSRDRFFSITGWSPAELRGKLVLDAGCGSGRFTEVALACGARIAAVDMSSAVEVCKDNVGKNSALVCQASIYQLPFERETFDYVFCIGVIQHTPDPKKAIEALAQMVKPGGHVGLWMYELNWKSFVGTTGFKYVLRPVTTRWSREKQIHFSEGLTATFWPLVKRCRTWGQMGKVLMRLLPVSCAHLHGLNLKEEDFRTWVRLDTFDMYSPRYDYPQRFRSIEQLLQNLGFEDIRRHPHGGISITGVKRKSY
jgi:2-polyprenyl-3-methyl-5-hydroxy-6-metoxy-1,4-benzoquinol methylase